jgi:hypothetical protein
VTFAIFTTNFVSGMDRFDTGANPTAFESLLITVQDVLFYPVVTFVVQLPSEQVRWLDGILGHIPYMLNSLLWAIGLYCIYHIFIKIIKKIT